MSAPLASNPGDGLAYLHTRGLTVETARKLGIGWNPADRYDRRTEWGLEDEMNPETGRFRKVWLPRGLVLPIRRKVGTVSVLIRRADWKPKDDLPKYWQVKGSGNGCCCLGAAGKPVVVVESVLDAVLVWQEAGDVAAAVALTGATKRPDAGTTAFLRAAPLVLWSLDFDEAGTKAWAWWAEHFQAVKCPPLAGKDPGDMRQAGIPIRLWVEAGIAEAGKTTLQDGEGHSLPGTSETSQNAPCEAVGSKSEPRAMPEANGPENGDKAAVVRWWRPWPILGTGELPAVTIHRGHVRHVYEDGTTRFVGIAAAPTIPNGPLAQWMRPRRILIPPQRMSIFPTPSTVWRLSIPTLMPCWVGGWCRTFRMGNWSLAASRTWARKTGPDWNAGLTIRDRTGNRAGNVWPAHYGQGGRRHVDRGGQPGAMPVLIHA